MAVALSPGGYLAAVDGGGTVGLRRFDTKTGKWEEFGSKFDECGDVYALSFLPGDRKLIWIKGTSLRIGNVETGEMRSDDRPS